MLSAPRNEQQRRGEMYVYSDEQQRREGSANAAKTNAPRRRQEVNIGRSHGKNISSEQRDKNIGSENKERSHGKNE